MIKLDLKIPNLGERLKHMMPEVALVLAAAMQTNRAMMFDKDGADNGKQKWAPLVLRSGRPLQDRGTLRQSFAPANDGLRPAHGKDGIVRTSGQEATIGTSLFYAHVMNDGTAKMPGGVIKAKKAKALKIPMQGGKFMFRKSVKIPPRRMDEITDLDKQEWADTLSNFLAARLNGAD